MKALWGFGLLGMLSLLGWPTAEADETPFQVEDSRFEALITGVISPGDLEAPLMGPALARRLGELPPQIITSALEVTKTDAISVEAHLHWNADGDGIDSGDIPLKGRLSGGQWTWSLGDG